MVVVSGREGERVTKRVGLLLAELHFSWERACGRQRERCLGRRVGDDINLIN